MDRFVANLHRIAKKIVKDSGLPVFVMETIRAFQDLRGAMVHRNVVQGDYKGQAGSGIVDMKKLIFATRSAHKQLELRDVELITKPVMFKVRLCVLTKLGFYGFDDTLPRLIAVILPLGCRRKIVFCVFIVQPQVKPPTRDFYGRPGPHFNSFQALRVFRVNNWPLKKIAIT
jgi:hypothetical protein